MFTRIASIFIGLLILLGSAGIPASAIFAAQQSSCQSARGGYCVQLYDASKPSAQKTNTNNLLFAQVPAGPTTPANPPNPTCGPFPGLEFLESYGITICSTIGTTLEAIYIFAMSLVGLSALIMIIYGGVMYITAGDSMSRVGQAKGYMTNAIYGLVLALCAFLILYIINPDLTFKLNLTNLTPVADGPKPPLQDSNPPPPGGWYTCKQGACVPTTTQGDPRDCLNAQDTSCAIMANPGGPPDLPTVPPADTTTSGAPASPPQPAAPPTSGIPPPPNPPSVPTTP